MKSTLYFLMGPLLAGGLAWLARKRGWLNHAGALASFVLGSLYWWVGGLWASTALIAFFLLGSLAANTNPRSRDRGGRSAVQVLANGLPPVLGMLLCGPAFLLGALAAAAADTLASEIGSRAAFAWRLGRGRVAPGTNAAVSLQGSLALLAGAALLALWSIPAGLPLLPALAAGVFGAALDTLTGPLEERLSWWTNDVNNAVAITAAGLLACWLIA
ncbi:DUF92 domain-containing protein [Oceanithermus sp.]